MSKLKASLLFFGAVILGTVVICLVFIRSLNWEHLITGATQSGVFRLPQPVFQTYIRTLHPINNSQWSSEGISPLHFLLNGCAGNFQTQSTCADLIDELLSQGLEIDAPSKDKLGLTPLHQTILLNDPLLAEFLISRKANVNALATGEKYNGMTPLRFANALKQSKNEAHPDYQQIVEIFRKHGGHE